MNFETTVQWHIKWLTSILDAMERNPAAMAPDDIARCDLCEFGAWICGQLTQYGDLPEYVALVKAHMDLHESAATAVRLAQDGCHPEAKCYLSPEGEFITLSKHLLDCSEQLFNKIGEIP